MPRFIKRRGKAGLIRNVEKRDAQAQDESANVTSTKRVRSSELLRGGSDLAMFDAGYEGDDDFSDAFEPLTGATDFDDADLAEMLVQDAEDDDFVVQPDENGRLRLIEEEMPSTTELQALADYQYRGEDVETHEDEAEDIFDDDNTPTPESVTEGRESATLEPTPGETSATLSGEELEPPIVDPFQSSIVKHTRRSHDMNDFTMAMGLYCIRNGVSRKEYAMLKEMLELLKDGEGIQKLDKLPTTVDTLKRYVKEELPLLEIRSQPVALNPDKLPSSRLRAAEVAGSIVDQPKQDMFFFNPIEFFKSIFASKLAASMHFGMAKLVDNPSEAYHSAQWAASIRTTSGEFAYYPDAPRGEEDEDEAHVQDYDGRDPIFPGDMIEFRCAHHVCNTCRPKEGVEDETRGTHIGQIMEIYRDYRTSRRLGQIGADEKNPVDEDSEGDIIFVVGRLWPGPKLLAINERVKLQIKINPVKKGDFHPRELVLVQDPLEYVSASMVVRRLTYVDFDYSFQSQHSFDDDFKPGLTRRFIRRAYSRSTLSFMPIGRVSPVPGVLEMLEFGREALVNAFVKPNGVSVRSFPVFVFSDGFGLYRTMFKSCMGVYIEIAALPKDEHARQINVFPLTLGPHGSNFTDVIKALEPMKALDKGLVVQVNGQEVVLCAPVLAFTGDMPQQQVNSGALGVTANKGCRSCEVTANKRGDLNFDTISNMRGHFEALRQRRALDELPTKAAKKKLSTETGLSLERPAMLEMAPALDLITTRPSDAAHSEFGGITKMLHQLLLDSAIKPQTVVDYARVLRKMPFPPGWAAIQSPYHVMSYSLQEHARWSILMTVIARCWLREDHLKAPFVRAMKVAFKDELDHGDFGANATAVDILIGVLTATVRTNCLLGGDQIDVQSRNPQVFMDIVYKGRQLFQKLCLAASIAAGRPRGTHAAARASSRVGLSLAPSVAPSEAGSVMASVEQDVEGDINVGHLSASQKAEKYTQWANRPNVHIGLHYRDVFHRYGLVSLLMVLSGELKHKVYIRVESKDFGYIPKPLDTDDSPSIQTAAPRYMSEFLLFNAVVPFQPPRNLPLGIKVKRAGEKLVVTQTNHRSPERDLFEYENLVQTIRLALIDGFKHSEPEITTMLQDLSKTVPTIFAGLLPHDHDISRDDAEDLDDPSISIKIVSDGNHYQPSALVRIREKHCKEVLGLPVRESGMSVAFRAKLRDAYRTDYEKNIIATGGSRFKWWKKVSFSKSHSTATSRRVVLHRGHYITYRGGCKGRLDQFFTHETPPGSGTLYLFCVVTPVIDLPGRVDLLTQLPILQVSSGQSLTTSDDQSNQEIVGLSALEDFGLYMIPFTQDETGWNLITDSQPTDEVLFVNWRIHFV
ncbi:hypothetical protein O1611_g1419 [Lasiodiplodia mahajangana]|uniref:Uncharacterized protein n=1 Tax=Lasiodiplodia mahajangana TaxID=1108764 RepID=A0ACC2JXS1_9PEZI|nr:hypothetical protein O1611_g1419 [Lasiodiplodia mahajangana]